MNIVIISSVYEPEPIVSAKTSVSLAEYLADSGHNVIVITAFPSRPSGKLFQGYRKSLYSKTWSDKKILIIRCFTIFSLFSSLLSRWLENISFGITAGIALLFLRNIEVIYSNSWPIFATGIIRLVAGLRRIPLVVTVQDLYPESLASQGRFGNTHPIYRFLLAVDNWIIKGCKTVIVISDRFAQVYKKERKTSPPKIKVIPNWVNANSIQMLPKCLYLTEKNIPDSAFVLVYGGNIGVAAGVEEFVEALSLINSPREIVLIIAGDGSQLEACKNKAAMIKNVRIIFHNPWLLEETSKVLASADVLILPTHGNQSFVSVPSKLISYLLASKPILSISQPESDITRIINQLDCGWAVEPGKPRLIASIISELPNYPLEDLDQKGKRGREYALSHMVSEVCLPQITEILTLAKN